MVTLDTKMQTKKFEVNLDNSEKLFINKVHFYFQSDIKGFLGGGDLGHVLSVAFQDLIPASLKHFEKRWSEELRNLLLPFMNVYLNRITYDDILQLDK